MVSIQIDYEGSLHCRLKHGPSGAEIVTDAPKDNQGKGEAFSPTDLVAAALGACMLTVMGIVAARRGVKLEGAHVDVQKEMAAEPRRIAQLQVLFRMPPGIAADQRKVLEHAAHTCPVHKSLHPDVAIPVEFRYPD